VLRRVGSPVTAREITGRPDSREGASGHPEAGRGPAGGYPASAAEAGRRNSGWRGRSGAVAIGGRASRTRKITRPLDLENSGPGAMALIFGADWSVLEPLIAATPPGVARAPTLVRHHLHTFDVAGGFWFRALHRRNHRPRSSGAFLLGMRRCN
jgi:hypothetical protein